MGTATRTVNGCAERAAMSGKCSDPHRTAKRISRTASIGRASRVSFGVTTKGFLAVTGITNKSLTTEVDS